MIKLIDIINELGINNPIGIKIYYSKEADLFKIINTGKLPLLNDYHFYDNAGNIEDEENILYKYPNLHYITKCIIKTYNAENDTCIGGISIRGNFPSKIAYVYVSGDGTTDIVDDLNKWSEGYRTEQENGVKKWEKIYVK